MTDEQTQYTFKIRRVRFLRTRLLLMYLAALLSAPLIMLMWDGTALLAKLYLGLLSLGILFAWSPKCPHCGKFFFFRFPFIWWFKELNALLRGECVNCGFPRILD
jgi:hypothetical protein